MGKTLLFVYKNSITFLLLLL